MKLFDLLTEAIGDLRPGERRIPPAIQLRDLEKIDQRIRDLQWRMSQSDQLQRAFQQDSALQAALTSLQTRLANKIRLLRRA